MSGGRGVVCEGVASCPAGEGTSVVVSSSFSPVFFLVVMLALPPMLEEGVPHLGRASSRCKAKTMRIFTFGRSRYLPPLVLWVGPCGKGMGAVMWKVSRVRLEGWGVWTLKWCRRLRGGLGGLWRGGRGARGMVGRGRPFGTPLPRLTWTLRPLARWVFQWSRGLSGFAASRSVGVSVPVQGPVMGLGGPLLGGRRVCLRGGAGVGLPHRGGRGARGAVRG